MTMWPPIVAYWYKQLILRGDERNYVAIVVVYRYKQLILRGDECNYVATVVVYRYKQLILGGEMNVTIMYVATNSGILV